MLRSVVRALPSLHNVRIAKNLRNNTIPSQTNTKHSSLLLNQNRYFSKSVESPDDDPMAALRAEFETIDVSVTPESSADFNVLGVSDRAGLPKINLKGNTGVHWAAHDDPMNPFNFPLLNLTPLTQAYGSCAIISGKDSEKTPDEIFTSFKHITASMKAPGGALSSDAKEGAPKYDPSTQNITTERDTTKVNMTQSYCKFDRPLVVRVPLSKSIADDAKTLFQAMTVYGDNSINESDPHFPKPEEFAQPEDGEDGEEKVPQVRVLQKAAFNGGLYDAYLAGARGDVIFFASTATQGALRNARLEQLRKHEEDSAKAVEKGFSVPECFIEHICIERNHIVSLLCAPVIRPLTPELVNMQEAFKTEISNDPNYDEVVGVLELCIESVVTTHDKDEPLGAPSSDQMYRSREIDFMIRSIVFGYTLPAPIPPIFHETAAEELRGDVGFAEGDRRRECIGRAIVALYGKASGLAAMPVALDEAFATEDEIGNDVANAILYGHPDRFYSRIDDAEILPENVEEVDEEEEGEEEVEEVKQSA